MTGVLGFLRDVAVPVVIFVVLPVFLWFQRDRRKSIAETAVAERTVGVDVNAKEAGALGASVAFVQEAFRVERESKDREIKSLTAKVARLELQHEQDEVRIAELEDRLIQLEARLTAAAPPRGVAERRRTGLTDGDTT